MKTFLVASLAVLLVVFASMAEARPSRGGRGHHGRGPRGPVCRVGVEGDSSPMCDMASSCPQGTSCQQLVIEQDQEQNERRRGGRLGQKIQELNLTISKCKPSVSCTTDADCTTAGLADFICKQCRRSNDEQKSCVPATRPARTELCNLRSIIEEAEVEEL